MHSGQLRFWFADVLMLPDTPSGANHVLFLLGALVLLGLLLAYIFGLMHLRRKEDEARNAIEQSFIQKSSRLSQRLNQRSQERAPADSKQFVPENRSMRDRREPKKQLIISGFDRQGSKVNIRLNVDDLKNSMWGVVIGRDDTLSDHLLPDPSNVVSRRHFRIRFDRDHDRYLIEDLDTVIGTGLNGKTLKAFTPVPMNAPSRINIGNLFELNLSIA